MYAGINGNTLGECFAEHDVMKIVRGEGSVGPLPVAAAKWEDSYIKNSRRFVAVSSPRRLVFSPRILRGVEFSPSISSLSSFHHCDDQRPFEATVPRDSAVLYFDVRPQNYVTKLTECKERYAVTSLQ
jgi:hypothetical protein